MTDIRASIPRNARPGRTEAWLALAVASAASALAVGSSSRALAADEAAIPIVSREARTGVAVTVYNQDLALIKDTRDLSLPQGESAIRFEDVASRIDPKTVAVRSVTAADRLAVVEQNYVFDLISPEKLMEKYVGREVELVETDETLKTQRTPATLLSTNGGLVYRIGDRIAVGHPGRVLLPKLPDQLYARPTLLWRLANSGPAKHKVEVSYLTGGMSWAADYVAVVNPEDTKTDLTGWVTITNQSGARYDDAMLKLVAGQVHRAEQAREMMMGVAKMEAGARAAPQFAEEGFFEYHLYTLDRPATLGENETKQMRLLSGSAVPVKKIFLLAGQNFWFRSKQGDLGRDLPVRVSLELKNDAASGLGMPLPAGTVRLYKEDRSGSQQFIGEDSIRHTPKDEKVTLEIGEAFDIVATRTQTDYHALNVRPYDVEVAFEVRIRNHKDVPVAVSVREPVGGEWKVVESTFPAVKVDAGTIGFEVPVPKDGEAVLQYRVQIAWR